LDFPADENENYSPDGQKIAFLKAGALRIVNSNGSNLRILSVYSFGSHQDFAPDGSKLIYVKQIKE